MSELDVWRNLSVLCLAVFLVLGAILCSVCLPTMNADHVSEAVLAQHMAVDDAIMPALRGHTGQPVTLTMTTALAVSGGTVIAANAADAVIDTDVVATYVPPTSVDISGPYTGIVNTAYAFTATVNPPTTTLPVTYTWQATGQSDVVTSVYALSHNAVFAWNTPGTQTITVTVAHDQSMVTQTHVVSISLIRAYLPLVCRYYPPVPYPPTLHPIADVDAFCGIDTAISWVEQPERLADVYILQEATNSKFTANQRKVCEASNQSCDVHIKPDSTYYYRVQGRNGWGYGAWSNIASPKVVPYCFDPAKFIRRDPWWDFYLDIRSGISCGRAGYQPSNLTDFVLEMTFQGGNGKYAQLYFKNPEWKNVYSTLRPIRDGVPIRFDPIYDDCAVREFTDFSNIAAVGAKIWGDILGVKLVSACLVRR